MKQRVTFSPEPNLDNRGTGAGLLWILLSLVLVALVFLPVVIG
jgi:hypothetical protein